MYPLRLMTWISSFALNVLIASSHDVALAIRNVAPISSQERCTILLMLLWPLAID